MTTKTKETSFPMRIEVIQDLSDDYLIPKWLIEGWLEEETIAIMYGQKHHKKSYVALSWAYHLAQGTNIDEARVNPEGTHCLYIPTEGHQTIRGRYEAFKKGYGELHKKKFGIFKDRWEWSEEFIEAFCKKLSKSTFIKLIIIDSLSQTIEDASVNSDSEMRKILRYAQKIRDRLKVTVLLVAHSGKNASKGIMGSSVLGNDVDTEIRVVDKKPPTITLTKQRNGSRDDMTMKFIPMFESIGQNDKGEHIFNLWLNYSKKGTHHFNDTTDMIFEAIKICSSDGLQKRFSKKFLRSEYNSLLFPEGSPKDQGEKQKINKKLNDNLNNLQGSGFLKLHHLHGQSWEVELPNENGDFE